MWGRGRRGFWSWCCIDGAILFHVGDDDEIGMEKNMLNTVPIYELGGGVFCFPDFLFPLDGNNFLQKYVGSV